MEIVLNRKYCKEKHTIGHLYLDGSYFCDTLEDPVRDLNKDGDLLDNGECKIYGDTAIPYGRYKVTLDIVSPKFGRISSYLWCKGFLPRLLNVNHFEGILIHAGNSVADTSGCILVGENRVRGRLVNSMDTFKKLYKVLEEVSSRGEEIWITIS